MAPKSSRRSFAGEFQLKAILYYYGNGKNVRQASNKFKVDRKQIRNWVKSGTETKTDFTFNTAGATNVSYNGERIFLLLILFYFSFTIATKYK